MSNVFGIGYFDKSRAVGYEAGLYKGIIWDTFRGPGHSLKRLIMKIRPSSTHATEAGSVNYVVHLYGAQAAIITYIQAHRIPSTLSASTP